MSIYFDPLRNVYVDVETGAIIPADEDPSSGESKSIVSLKDSTENDHALAMSLADMESSNHNTQMNTSFHDYMMNVQALEMRNPSNQSYFQQFFDRIRHGDYVFRRGRSNSTLIPSAPDAPDGHSDDWFLARALQAMEFEIQEDLQYGGMITSGTEADFRSKELRASSCLTQLFTLSTLIVLIQIGVLVAEIQIYGYAPKAVNPLIGPDAQALVNFGAKEAGLILHRGQWWRCLTAIFVHAGILHLLSNGAIQLRVGGYLNQVYGTISWFLIYFMSGWFGNMMSCIFSPNTVSVGSSGAIMGILTSWVVWILFRWNRIPDRAKANRNCQLLVVLACIGVILGTSFSSYIDWAAHYGGASMGALWGIFLISRELENERTKLAVRIFSVASICGYFAWALYYMLAVVEAQIVLAPN